MTDTDDLLARADVLAEAFTTGPYEFHVIRDLAAALRRERAEVERLQAELANRNDEPVCAACANSGWIGSRSDPKNCPRCGRTPYFLGAVSPAPTEGP